MQFANAKSLAQARRNLMEKVRQASGTGVHIFERSMSNDLQVPSKTRGISFLSALSLFVCFLVVLSYEAVYERSPLQAATMALGVKSLLANTSDVVDKNSLKDYLAYVLPRLPLQQYKVLNSRRVGSIRVRQLRSSETCSPNSLWLSQPNPVNVSCIGDITSEDSINTSSFVGKKSGMLFPFIMDDTLCLGLFCQVGLLSSIQDNIRYPYMGNEFFLDDGHIYTRNGSLVEFPTPTTNNGSTNTTASNATTPTPTTNNSSTNTNTTTEAPVLSDDPPMVDIMNDFVDITTRLIQVEFTLYTPSMDMATAVLLNFECPSSGGVYLYFVIQSTPLFDTKAPRCVFLWVYAVLQILINFYAFVQSLRHTFDCGTCTQSNTLIVFKCVKCSSACELCIGKVSLCGTCGTPVPALRHSCWRSVLLDVWRMIAIISVSALLASRYATTYSIEEIERLVVDDSLLGISTLQTTKFLSLAPAFSIYRQGVSALQVTIICTYVRMFYYVCRGQSGSQFARVLQYALVPLIAFSINFLVTFSGFCFAFTMVSGYLTPNFSTLSNSYLTSFRFLLSQVGWEELGTVTPAMMVLLVAFFCVCLCLMFNVFPSVLNVSYKLASRTPYYDVDVISMWLLLKRYVLIPTGIIKKRKKVRGHSSSTISNDSMVSSGSSQRDVDDRSSVASAATMDTTAAQIEALRSGARMEDLMAQTELKALVTRTDNALIKLTVQEEQIKQSIETLVAELKRLNTLLPPMLHGKVDEFEAHVHRQRVASKENVEATQARDLARHLLSENQDSIDRLASQYFALPIIEDTSLLLPTNGQQPFQDSDEDDAEELPKVPLRSATKTGRDRASSIHSTLSKAHSRLTSAALRSLNSFADNIMSHSLTEQPQPQQSTAGREQPPQQSAVIEALDVDVAPLVVSGSDDEELVSVSSQPEVRRENKNELPSPASFEPPAKAEMVDDNDLH